MKECFRCKITKPVSDFSVVGTGKRAGKIHSYCKSCMSNEAVERQRAFKRRAIEYKGGICVDCGFSGNPAVYDFHHLDPNEKDFNISKVKSYKWTENVEKELDKCVLLCSNCHRIRHTRINTSWARLE